MPHQDTVAGLDPERQPVHGTGGAVDLAQVLDLDEDPAVRAQALIALGQIDHPRARDRLAEATMAADDEAVCKASNFPLRIRPQTLRDNERLRFANGQSVPQSLSRTSITQLGHQTEEPDYVVLKLFQS